MALDKNTKAMLDPNKVGDSSYGFNYKYGPQANEEIVRGSCQRIGDGSMTKKALESVTGINCSGQEFALSDLGNGGDKLGKPYSGSTKD